MSSTISTAPPRASRSAAAVKDPFAELFRKGGVSRKAIQELDGSGNDLVTISQLQLVDNGDDTVTLSCTLAANSSDNLITTVGMLLSDDSGNVLGSFYFYPNDDGLNTGSCEPILTTPIGDLTVGGTANAMIYGVLAGQQYFNPSYSVTVTSQ